MLSPWSQWFNVNGVNGRRNLHDVGRFSAGKEGCGILDRELWVLDCVGLLRLLN